MSTVPGTPSWVLDVAEDTVHWQRQHLIEAMLEHGEDVTDNVLWRHRRSQLESLLASGKVLAVKHSAKGGQS